MDSSHLLVDDVSRQRVVVTFSVAIFSWLVWDTLIHLDTEIDHIWRRPRSWTQPTYFFMRYVTLFEMGAEIYMYSPGHSEITCSRWSVWEQVFSITLKMQVDIVLMLRVHALYNKSRTMLVAISGLFVAEYLVPIVFGTLTDRKVPPVPGSCVDATAPPLFLACWITALVFETVLFGLTLAALPRRGSGGYAGRSVANVIVRDGTWAFALVFAAFLTTVVLYTPSVDYGSVGYYLTCSVVSFAGSHVMLNLRSFVPSEPQSLPTIRDTNEFQAATVRTVIDRPHRVSASGSTISAYFTPLSSQTSFWSFDSSTQPREHIADPHSDM